MGAVFGSHILYNNPTALCRAFYSGETECVIMKIDGKTIQLGVIGCPVEHTFSPAIHNFIADREGDNCVYCAWRVEKENLSDMICGMRAMNIRGINATIPHKLDIMQYLDEVSEQAKMLGSVNTVVNRNGRLCGYNTDADGFYKALCTAEPNVSGKNILILGAGGVVKPVLIRLIQENPKSVTIMNRTREKAEALSKKAEEQTGFCVYTDMREDKYDIVINTTSAGMSPQTDVLPIDSIDGIDNLDFIGENTTVFDMIYNPSETLFLKEAKKRGAKTMNGLDMLINQGILAYELFMDKKLPGNIGAEIKSEVFGQ